MNNSFRRVTALLLLMLLCGCGRGGETAEIRYYRLASGQSANHLANQACERFCSLVEKESGGAIQIIPSFENELGTDASALEQCVYGGIDYREGLGELAELYRNAPQWTENHRNPAQRISRDIGLI